MKISNHSRKIQAKSNLTSIAQSDSRGKALIAQGLEIKQGDAVAAKKAETVGCLLLGSSVLGTTSYGYYALADEMPALSTGLGGLALITAGMIGESVWSAASFFRRTATLEDRFSGDVNSLAKRLSEVPSAVEIYDGRVDLFLHDVAIARGTARYLANSRGVETGQTLGIA